MSTTHNSVVLDFEKTIVEVEAKIESLKLLAQEEDVDISSELNRLQEKLNRQLRISYSNLSPWQKAQVARHPDRPHCLDYVHSLIEDFVSNRTKKKFSAFLVLNNKGEIGFEFVKRSFKKSADKDKAPAKAKKIAASDEVETGDAPF